MASVDHGKSIPVLYARGSHYDIGFQVGSTFKNKITQFYQTSKLVQGKLIPFCQQRKGQEIIDLYLQNVKESFPQYLRELQGIADGTGMPFEKVFCLNVAKEIYNFHINDMKNWTDGGHNSGCSSIMINKPGLKLLAHNEDCDPTVKDFGYIVSAHVIEDDVNYKFTAFTYPGALSGTTFSFNNHGMIYAVNGLYPKVGETGATPRYFLNRAMLSAKDSNHVAEIVKNKGHGCALSFNINLGSFKDPKDMWDIEVGPGKDESRIYMHTIHEQNDDTKTCSYAHTNHYLHLDVENMVKTSSTFERMKRIKEFPPPSSLDEIKVILGDTDNKKYPIYRTERGTDRSQTVATAIFDLIDKKVDIYTDNLKDGTEPLISLPLS